MEMLSGVSTRIVSQLEYFSKSGLGWVGLSGGSMTLVFVIP